MFLKKVNSYTFLSGFAGKEAERANKVTEEDQEERQSSDRSVGERHQPDRLRHVPQQPLRASLHREMCRLHRG